MKYLILILMLSGCATVKPEKINKECYEACMQNLGYATGLPQKHECDEDGENCWGVICGDVYCGRSYNEQSVNKDKVNCFEACYERSK